MRATFPFCLALTVLAGCSGPLGPIPGGRLGGVVATAPVRDWSFVREQPLIQLETRPRKPYSVTTEYLLLDGRLYVSALDPEGRRWPQYVSFESEVRVRVGEVIYEASARRVTDRRERENLLQQIAYERGPHDPALDLDRTIWFFRLEPR